MLGDKYFSHLDVKQIEISEGRRELLKTLSISLSPQKFLYTPFAVHYKKMYYY